MPRKDIIKQYMTALLFASVAYKVCFLLLSYFLVLVFRPVFDTMGPYYIIDGIMRAVLTFVIVHQLYKRLVKGKNKLASQSPLFFFLALTLIQLLLHLFKVLKGSDFELSKVLLEVELVVAFGYGLYLKWK